MDMTSPMQPKPLVRATCKLGTKGCYGDGKCYALGDCENKIVTNADKIRAMSDEELAMFFTKRELDQAVQRKVAVEGYALTATFISSLTQSAFAAWVHWLRSPVEG